MIPSFMFIFGFYNKLYLNQNIHACCTSAEVWDALSNAPFKLIKRRFARHGLYKLVKWHYMPHFQNFIAYNSSFKKI